MAGETSNLKGWLTSLKSCLVKENYKVLLLKIKQYIISVKQHLDDCSPLVRHCLAAFFVTMAGVCTPSAAIGEYRICLCNLAIGMGLMVCLLGGPSYVLSVFLGLLFFNYYQGYSLLGGSYLFISFLSSFTICIVSIVLRRLGIRGNISSSSGQLILYLLEGLVLPVCLVGVIIMFVAQYNNAAGMLPSFSFSGVTGKLLCQSLIAAVLGLLVCFTIFQPFYEFNEYSALGFARSALFMMLGLAFLVSMYRSQAVDELNRDLKILQDQALNVKHALEYQVNLQLRSIHDLEYLVLADSKKVLDRKHAEVIMEDGGSRRIPWNMVLGFKAVERPQPAKGAKGAGNQRRYRYVTTLQKTYKRSVKLPFSLVRGQVIGENTPLGHWLVSAEDPKLRGQSASQSASFYSGYYITQMNSKPPILVCVCPCYVHNKLVGVVVTGVLYEDLLRKAVGLFHTDKIGVRIKRFEKINDANSSLQLLYNKNYESNSLFSTTVDAGFGNSDTEKLLQLDVSYTPGNGVFLLNSLENFSFYVVLLVVVGTMSNILMQQYALLDEKARQQVRKLDDKERYNSRITLAMSDCLVTTDLDVKIVSANSTACALFATAEDNLKGKNFHKLVHHGRKCLEDGSCSAAKYYNYIRGLLKSDTDLKRIKPQRTSSFVVDENGNEISFEGSFTVMQRDNGDINIICLFRNVDSDVKLQKMRSDYVATLSHEMRTPLSCIKGTVDMFTKFGPKMLEGEGFSAKGKQMLDVAQRNVNKLEQLINDVLLCDSVDNNTLLIEPQRQPVEPIVMHVVESMREVADKEGIQLRVGTVEGEAEVDAMRLDQVLTNLIGNAVKYSKSGSEIFVEAKLNENRDFIVFSVLDHGEGIPQESIPQLFNRFSVVNSDSVRKRGGLGLGLTICRGLVNAHGGDIWVQSKFGTGSVFKFTIPVAK